MVESLVAIGIASVSILTLVTGVQYVTKQIHTNTSKNSLNSALDSIYLKIKAAVDSDYAWEKTVQANSNLQCNQVSNPCYTVHSGGSPVDLTLKDSLGTTIFNPGGTPNAYSLNGAPCTHDSTQPELCPLLIDLKFLPSCPSGAPCHDSPIKVTGTISLHSAVTSNHNIADRKFEIVKVPPDYEDVYFGLKYTTSAGVGGGNCPSSPSWITRPINSSPYKDPGGNIVNIDSSTNTFTLKAGTYVCKLKAMAYGYGSTRTRLRSTSGTMSWHLLSGGTNLNTNVLLTNKAITTTPVPPASPYESKILKTEFDYKFTISTDQDFVIEQDCTSLNASNPAHKLGHPSGTGTPEYLNFTCKKKKHEP